MLRPTVKVKKLSDKAIIPTYGSTDAAGLDLYAALDKEVVIPSRDMVKIPTDISIEIPYGYFGGIYARSGLAVKEGLAPTNCVGVVDADYRGNIVVALYNKSKEPRTITPGQRIAQLIIQPYLSVDLKEVEDLTETERQDGGFGSTGKN